MGDFLDPDTGAIRDWVRIGAGPPSPAPDAGAAVSPDGRLLAVTAQFGTTVLDAGTLGMATSSSSTRWTVRRYQ